MASHVRKRYLLAATAAVLLARYATQAQPTIAITAFPAPGSLDAVSGKVNGLPGGAYKVVMYLSGQANSWWIKPQVRATLALGCRSGAGLCCCSM